MESSRPAASDPDPDPDPDPGAKARRRSAIAATLAWGVCLGVLGVAYFAWARPGVAGANAQASADALSALLGWRVLPRNALVTADRLAMAVALLGTFVFVAWGYATGTVSRRAAVLAILAMGAALRVNLALQDPVTIRRWPLDDDSHYYFNIAFNLAHGNGLRHDGFHATTGVQPLFLLLITPIYAWVESKAFAVNAVLLLQTGLGLALGVTLASLARRVAGDAAALLVLGVWAFSAFFVATDLNGLETSLSLLFVSAVVARCWKLREDPGPPGRGALVGLGALLGLAFLARTDNGLLGVAFALTWIAADRWRRPLRERVADVALVAVVAGAFALPWLALNLAWVGSVVPSGGQAVRFLSLAYGYRMVEATGPAFPVDAVPLDYYTATLRSAFASLREITHDTVGLRPGLGFAVLGSLAAVGAAVSHLRRLAMLWTFLALLVGAYTSYVFGQWYFERYLAPFAVAWLLVLAIAQRGLLERFASRRGAVQALVALALAVSLGADVVRVLQGRPRRVRGFYDAARWVDDHVPEGVVVAGFQTGIFGYYVDRPFYGLDGKINIDALDAMRERRIDRYIQESPIEYLVDWPFVLDDLLVARSADPDFLDRQRLVYSNGDVVVYQLLREESQP